MSFHHKFKGHSLHHYCKSSTHYETVEEILKLQDGNYRTILEETRGVSQHTPLHEAVHHLNAKTARLLLKYGANVNSKANMSYTPLHLASSNNDITCVKLLLEHHDIDIGAKDDQQKTAFRTADILGNKEIAKYIKSAEIKQAARKNCDTLESLLQNLDGAEVTPMCLHDAIHIAATEGHIKALSTLFSAAVKNNELLKSVKPEHSISVTLQNGFYDVSSLLMLCYFAKKGLVILIRDLLDQKLCVSEFSIDAALSTLRTDICDHGTYISSRENIRAELKNKNCKDLAAAINYAEVYHQYEAVHTLLYHNCVGGSTMSPKCNWRRLGLRHLTGSLVTDCEFMKNLSCVDLRDNTLQRVAGELFQLDNLHTLMLCNNSLQELPTELPWVTQTLRTLHLSQNSLSMLPKCFADSKITELYLDKNNFHSIPQCVLELTSLENLNIKENPAITEIPNELGKLRRLHTFKFDVAKIVEPPNIEAYSNKTSNLVKWLWNRLRKAKKYTAAKLMVTGWQNQGKTTLIHRLEYDKNFKENVATTGVQISELKKPKSMLSLNDPGDIKFQVWDFAGHEDYYVTHVCFLSAIGLYLLVWNLVEGENGVRNLGPWLDTIAARQERTLGVCSGAAPTVIVVGTHLDEIRKQDAKYAARYVETMRVAVREMISKRYGDQIFLADVVEVSCAFGSSMEGIDQLREKIFKQGKELVKIVNEIEIKLLDERVPHSFFALVDRIRELRSELIQKERLPVLGAQEFRDEIQKVVRGDSADVEHPDDFEEALRFLKERGIMLHFDDPNGNLRDLYFIDPIWLCRLMTRVITFSTSSANFVDSSGILEISKLQRLEKDQQFPAKYQQQYIRLLNRLQVVYSLDDQRLLVPSKLPSKKPDGISITNPIRRVIHLSHLPHGFFSRLTARLLHFVPDLIDEVDSVHSANENKSGSLTEASPAFHQTRTSEETGGSLLWEETACSEVLEPGFSVAERKCCEKMGTTKGASVVKLLQDGQLRCWRTGIHLQHLNFSFLLELAVSHSHHVLEVQVFPSAAGRHALSFIVDHIDALVDDWFSGLQSKCSSIPSVQRLIPCTECTTLNLKPHDFTFEECLELVARGDDITCPHHKDVSISLSHVAPDLKFLDVSSELLLQPHELSYNADCKFSVLDHGSFGKVYRGQCRNESAAIKVFRNYSGSLYELYRELRKEVNVLRRVLRHQNLVTMLGVSLRPPCLALELAEHRSLADTLFGNSYVPRLVLFMIAYEVADAVSYLHGLGIIHRDLKAKNVLLYSLNESDEVHVKLTDFGTANFAGPCGLKSEKGPVEICAPEMLEFADKEEYGVKVDVYSFGILLYSLITRRPAFATCSNTDVREKVLRDMRPVWRDVAAATHSLVSMTQLMCKCWQQKPSDRSTALEARDQLARPVFQLLMSKLAFPAKSKVECVTLVPSKHQLWVAVKENDVSSIVVISLDDLRLEHVVEVEGDHVTIRQMSLVEDKVLVILRERSADHVSMARFYSTSDYMLQSGSQLSPPVLDLTCVHHSIVLAHGSGGCRHYSTGDELSIDCAFVHGNVKLLTGRPVISVASTSGSLWALSVNTLHIFGLPLSTGSNGSLFGTVIPLSNACEALGSDVNSPPDCVHTSATADHNTAAYHSAAGGEDVMTFKENVFGEFSTLHVSSETIVSLFTKQTTRNASSPTTEQHPDSVPSVLPQTSDRCSACRSTSVPDSQCYSGERGRARIQASADGEFVWILRNNTLIRWKVEDQSHFTVFSLPGNSDIDKTEPENAAIYGDITCFEPALDTVWVVTCGGFLLIASAVTGAVLGAFRPYEQPVTSLTFCTFMSPPTMISCGKSLNRAALTGQETRDPVCWLSLDRTEVLPLGLHSRLESSSRRKSKKTRAQNLNQAERVIEGHWIENNTETDHVMLVWHVTSTTNLEKMNKIRAA